MSVTKLMPLTINPGCRQKARTPRIGLVSRIVSGMPETLIRVVPGYCRFDSEDGACLVTASWAGDRLSKTDNEGEQTCTAQIMCVKRIVQTEAAPFQ